MPSTRKTTRVNGIISKILVRSRQTCRVVSACVALQERRVSSPVASIGEGCDSHWHTQRHVLRRSLKHDVARLAPALHPHAVSQTRIWKCRVKACILAATPVHAPGWCRWHAKKACANFETLPTTADTMHLQLSSIENRHVDLRATGTTLQEQVPSNARTCPRMT